jgi:hypothetical protein
MPSSLPRFSPLFLLAGLLVMLGGCAQTGSDLGCPAERTELTAAAQAVPAAPAVTGEAYLTQLRQAGVDDAATARRLAGEVTALGAAVDRVDTGYGALDHCRRARAEALRRQLAAGSLDTKSAGQRLAAEKQTFDGELAQGRAAAARIAGDQAILQEAAERLVAAAPGGSTKVAKAVAAAAPQQGTPYMVTQSAEIFAKPDAGSARIADLRKGQRVQGPGSGPVAGWVTLTLNDGSLGYVTAEVLRQVQPNPSALRSAAQAKSVRTADGDPVVALAIAARETLPAKTQAFASKLDLAASDAAEAFAAEPPAPAAAAEPRA